MSAEISELGQLDQLTGQLSFHTAGTGGPGLTQRVSIPQTLPGAGRVFIVESAALFITDDNANGTLAVPYPDDAITQSELWIVPASAQANADTLDSAGGSPPSFNIAQLGPAVIIQRMRNNAGAGTSLSQWVLDSQRNIFVPPGYALAAFIQSPQDGTPHDITATLIAQVRWFNTQECAC